MKVKKYFFPVLVILIVLISIVILFSKKEKSPVNQNNITENKTTDIKIGDKEVSLTIKKIEDPVDTPYSLTAQNKGDKTTYSSQVIKADVLGDFENIKTENLNNETLIIVKGLSVGAHSSGLRVFKVDPIKKQITPICVYQEKQTKDDPCLFYADAMTEPFFDDVDKDGIDELVEMNRGTENPREVVLSAVYEYKNSQFIPLSGNDYEKAHEFLSKSFTSGTDEPFKLLRNTENTN